MPKLRSQERNVWTDKNGVEFRIPDLTDEHLINILRMLYRKNVQQLRNRLLVAAKRLHDIGDYEDPVDISDGPPSYCHTMADERKDLAQDGTDQEVLTYFVPQLPTLEWEAKRRELFKPLGGMKQ